MTKAAEDAPLMTIDDVAGRWKVSPRTIQRLIASRQLRCVRIGRAVRLRVEDVLNYEVICG